jgi:hypothetical protein
MAKNKKKSFSKVNVSVPIINSSDNNEPIKLDELNTIPSQIDEEAIELPKGLTSVEYTETTKPLETNELTKTAEALYNDEACQKLKEHDCKISDEQSFTEKDECYILINEDNKVSEDKNLVIVNEIVVSEVTLELDNNVSNKEEEKNTVELTENQNKNEEKNSVELTEIQNKNEETDTTDEKLKNCSRKFCSIL